MKKRSIIAFAIMLSLICNFLGVGTTGAWFVSGGTLGTGDFKTAKVLYLPTVTPTAEEKSIYGELIDGSVGDNFTFLIPGYEIIKQPELNPNMCLSFENFSTVVTNVRVRINLEFLEHPVEGMVWQKVLNSDNTYQYGKLTNILNSDGTVIESNVFMGLIEVNFANTTIGNTIIPNAATDNASPFSATAYHFEKISDAPLNENQISFADAWELKVNNSSDVPPLGADRQFFNVITSVKIVGDALDPKYQNEFNSFFSDNYAGKTIKLSIDYYAKQSGEFMPWNEFTKTVFEAKIPS